MGMVYATHSLLRAFRAFRSYNQSLDGSVMTNTEMIAQVERWAEMLRQQSKELRTIIGNGVPPHWRQRSLESYQFDSRCYEFMIFGLDRLKDIINRGEI